MNKNPRCLICLGCLTETVSDVFDTRFGLSNQYKIGICSSCGLEQTFPVPNDLDLKLLYEKYYNYEDSPLKVFSGLYVKLRSLFQKSFIWFFWLKIDGDISFHSYKGSGLLLDIGCNEGRGLEFYRANGFCAEGLELNRKAAELARKKGFVVHEDLLDSFNPVRKYNVVILSNVLEHSTNPRQMLLKARALLIDDGVLLISCPNAGSIFRIIFKKYWINWHVPFHITHFTERSLKNLINECGFKVIESRNVSPSLWLTHSILATIFCRRGVATQQLRSVGYVCSLMLAIRFVLFPLLWFANQLGRGDCLILASSKAKIL
jgi:SAM-dependent methyltransferase